jgi:uncharacterized protein YcfJ
MSKKIYTALVLALLAALGASVGAAAAGKRWRPPAPPMTTTAATTAAAATTTTTDSSTTTTTDSSTTTVATTTSTPPPVPGSVKITSPVANSAHKAVYSNVILAAHVEGATTGGTCTITWGDGKASEAALVPDTAAGGYSCGTSHQYMQNPPGVSYTQYKITVTAVDGSTTPVSSDCTQIYVI